LILFKREIVRYLRPAWHESRRWRKDLGLHAPARPGFDVAYAAAAEKFTARLVADFAAPFAPARRGGASIEAKAKQGLANFSLLAESAQVGAINPAVGLGTWRRLILSTVARRS